MPEKNKVAVVALGGNALVRKGERGEVQTQLQHIRESVLHLPGLLKMGYRLVITHGNGPVVGHLLLQNEAARAVVPPMPLDVCDADSEGSIGYLTQQTLVNELRSFVADPQVVSLITQVVVDSTDPAFRNPTKPIGPFYTEIEAKKLRSSKGWSLVDDAGRGYRRVVPSPHPKDVVELEVIRLLLEHSVIVVAAGGGGIPVVRDVDGRLKGIEAVIDKDRASSLLASLLKAQLLIILTAEPYVFRGYGTKSQSPILQMSCSEACALVESGEFAPGSMEPKVEAAIEFLKGGGQEVLITLPECLDDALQGRVGTRIVP